MDRMIGGATIPLLLLVAVTVNLAADNTYTFDDCDALSDSEYMVDGAVVISHTDSPMTLPAKQCTYIFKAMDPAVRFLVKFVLVDIHEANDTCIDNLTLTSYVNNNYTHKILDQFCGTVNDLPVENIYTWGGNLHMTWSTGGVNGRHLGFRLILSAVSSKTESCDTASRFRCENDDCLSTSLLCDGVPHCLTEEDELCAPPLPPTDSPFLKTTTNPGSGDWGLGDVDMVSVVLVAVVFVLVLIICLALGCREQRERDRRRSEATPLTGMNSSIQVNTNPGYSSDRPPTPPPTYSFIERQTSIVSHISQTSSQLSFPPAYDEALEITGAPGEANNNNMNSAATENQPARLQVSRSISRSSSGSRRQRRLRMFSRTASNQNGANRGRYTSNTTEYSTESERRNASDGPVPPVRFRIESDTSSVFEDLGGLPPEESDANVILEESHEDSSANQQPDTRSPEPSPRQLDVTTDNAEVALLTNNNATSDTDSHHSDSNQQGAASTRVNFYL